MPKFIHIGDCHLGGWRHPELQELNRQSFEIVIDTAIKEKVDFLLIAGDLFDSAYPPIEILKFIFEQFRRTKRANIPIFLIAGSHDYSASGKTFLEVLEKAGFCENVTRLEERDNKLVLQPTIYKDVAIYGYPGKKSGLEVDDIERITLNTAPGLYSILMLHTTIKDAVKDIPIKSVDESKLPRVDYLALAHLHIRYNKANRVYSGPTFPNNIAELEELKYGSYYLIENNIPKRHELKIKEVLPKTITIKDTLAATDQILKEFENENVEDKIVILRVAGLVEKGKMTDIDFGKIESILKERGAFIVLRSTSRLHIGEPEVSVSEIDSETMEETIINAFIEKHPSPYNNHVHDLMRILATDKNEDETNMTFESRLITESKKVLNV